MKLPNNQLSSFNEDTIEGSDKKDFKEKDHDKHLVQESTIKREEQLTKRIETEKVVVNSSITIHNDLLPSDNKYMQCKDNSIEDKVGNNQEECKSPEIIDIVDDVSERTFTRKLITFDLSSNVVKEERKKSVYSEQNFLERKRCSRSSRAVSLPPKYHNKTLDLRKSILSQTRKRHNNMPDLRTRLRRSLQN